MTEPERRIAAYVYQQLQGADGKRILIADLGLARAAGIRIEEVAAVRKSLVSKKVIAVEEVTALATRYRIAPEPNAEKPARLRPRQPPPERPAAGLTYGEQMSNIREFLDEAIRSGIPARSRTPGNAGGTVAPERGAGAAHDAEGK